MRADIADKLFDLRKGRHPKELGEAMTDLVHTLSVDHDTEEGFVAKLWRTVSAAFAAFACWA